MAAKELEIKAKEYANKTQFTEYDNYSLSESLDISEEIKQAYIAGAKEHAQQWHKIFTDSTPYCYEYWDLPQETLPQIENFYFVKLKNGFIKICELKYDTWSKKKCFYDLHGGKQSNVAEWLDYPKE